MDKHTKPTTIVGGCLVLPLLGLACGLADGDDTVVRISRLERHHRGPTRSATGGAVVGCYGAGRRPVPTTRSPSRGRRSHRGAGTG